jgi:AbrB family looped-hinge helix DNA binding protein
MNERDTALVSKVTQKYQATIPQAVREKLGIQQGDRITFEIEEGQVVIKKVIPVDWEYLDAVADTLSEWSSEADEEAYCDL